MNLLTSLDAVYVASGIVLVVFGCLTFADRSNASRLASGLFWGLLGVTFALGSVLPAWTTGLMVVAMVIVDGLGLVRPGVHHDSRPEEQIHRANRFGWKILIPVLMIPTVTYGASLIRWSPDVSADRIVFVSLGYASIAAGIVALALTKARPLSLIQEGRRLTDDLGTVVILPQLLASLGILFTTAGVGKAIARIVGAVIPTGNPLAIAFTSCLIIAALTFAMGNSFAGFPVIMAGLGIPLLVRQFHADPAAVGLLLLTAASSGTLCTPMAANFNTVPAALLGMHDSYGVIKFQLPYAMGMFVVHVILLWLLITAT